MTHTQEPWDYINNDDVVMIFVPPHKMIDKAIKEKKTITSVRIALLHDSFYTPKDVCEANARRIVAAVNFLKGISTDELETLVKNGWDFESFFRNNNNDVPEFEVDESQHPSD